MRHIASGICILAFCLTSRGQDVHFSQFYASPLTLSPAMTGFFNGGYRIAANYRSQWASIDDAGFNGFITASASYDMTLFRNQKLGKDFIGFGIMVLNDNQGLLSDSRAMISGTYHKNLNLHNLALGFQAGVNQKAINIGPEITWPSDWSDIGGGAFIPGNGTTDVPASVAKIYPDFQTGLLWYASLSQKIDAFAGFALFHITQPKESFLPNLKYKLPSRYVVNAGTRFKVSSTVDVVPHFLYMLQSATKEINIGSSVEYAIPSILDGEMGIAFGPYFRWATTNVKGETFRDIIAMTGLMYRNFRFGFSYDVNVNGLDDLTRKKGGFELSLIFVGNVTTTTRPVIVPCPRF